MSDVPGREPASEQMPETPSPGRVRAPALLERWWESTQFKVALVIAVVECLFVAAEEDFSRVTIIVIAIPIVLFYLLAGRTLESRRLREISWILAMSQALAAVAAVIAWIAPTVALILAGLLAGAVIYLLVRESSGRGGSSADSR